MNWVDAAMLATILLSALVGFLRGFARELLGLTAWIAAAFIANRYYTALVPLSGRWIDDPLVADVVCFSVLFVLILIACSILANLLSRLVRFSLLGGIDRLLGAGFGLVRGVVLLVLAYIVLAFVLPPENWPQPVRQAQAIPLLHAGARYALARAPERWRPALPSLGPPLGDDGSPSSQPDPGQESF